MARRIDVESIEARSHVAHVRRPGRAVFAGVLVIVLLFVLATRTVPHPVGPARTEGKFRGKAVTTAEGALSAVNVTTLIARTYNDGRAFGSYAGLVAGDAEESLGGLQSTFESIQPPSEKSDLLADELGALLSASADHARAVRVAIRRSHAVDEADVRDLREDARNLGAFIDENS